MRKLLKSIFSLSWSMSLLGVKTMADAISPRRDSDERAGGELDAVARAAEKHLSPPLGAMVETGTRLQEEAIEQMFGFLPGGGGDCDAWRWPANERRGRLDTSRFVTLGDGLAAGMGHFSLELNAQSTSFPAFVAQSLGTPFEQPLIEPPGLGDVISFAPQKPIVPNLQQSSVRVEVPGGNRLGNLSVPGLTVHQALHARPRVPIVHRDDNQQNLINFILGLPDLAGSPQPGMTQLEYACSREPTLALVCLGYSEAIAAAVAGTPAALPDVASFGHDYAQLLRGLDRAAVIVATVPDPLDTAYFSSLEVAARILKTEPSFLEKHYGLAPDDQVTVPGLYEMGYQMMNHQVGALDRRPAIDGTAAAGIRAGVQRLNGAITEAARETGALVFDLHLLCKELARTGLVVGKVLTSDYLGGLYLLNGLYPGPSLNSVIASELVRLINRTAGEAYFEAPITAVVANDANTLSQLAPGPPATDAFLQPLRPEDFLPLPPIEPPPPVYPIQTVYPNLQPGKETCTPLVGVPAGGLSNPEQPIQLPPGLEQTLELNPEGSSVGDALRCVDCPNDRPFIPNFPPFGTCPNVYLGGLAVVSSRLRGKIHVKFEPPDERGQARFEIRHPGGLVGEDAVLQAPQMFKMGARINVVEDVEGLVSSGVVDVNTGLVTNFHYNVRNFNTAILALLNVNPKLPPPALTFPGAPNGGSTWLQFDPRDDGKLDVTLAGNLFLPLGLEAGGDPIRFPLPFSNPKLQCASFVARGTTLHPRVHVTTRQQPPPEPGLVPTDFKFNSVREYTCFTHNTSFGDEFELNNPALGATTGQSLLTGRIRVQFGPRAGGNTVAVVFQALPPGGLLDDQPVTPPFLPPGTSRSLTGFDVTTHFKKAVYQQTGAACPDDPFNLGVGILDLASGRIMGELLFRGYVVQSLFGDLIQVEPCTPADSFLFQGPARFERGADGQTVFRFEGKVFLPYPPGFNFPSPGPGGRPPFKIGPGSKLDPFRWIQAMEQPRPFSGTMRGDARRVISSEGQTFSYRYDIPCAGDGAERAFFEYTNEDQRATFRMTTLTWVDCSHTRGAGRGSRQPDIVTFAGYGTWSPDRSGRLHQAVAQFSVAESAPYVGIQVDGGSTSNVNTKPKNLEETRP